LLHFTVKRGNEHGVLRRRISFSFFSLLKILSLFYICEGKPGRKQDKLSHHSSYFVVQIRSVCLLLSASSGPNVNKKMLKNPKKHKISIYTDIVKVKENYMAQVQNKIVFLLFNELFYRATLTCFLWTRVSVFHSFFIFPADNKENLPGS